MSLIVWTSCVKLGPDGSLLLSKIFCELERNGKTVVYLSLYEEENLASWTLHYDYYTLLQYLPKVASETKIVTEYLDRNPKWGERLSITGNFHNCDDVTSLKIFTSCAFRLLTLIQPDLLIIWNPYGLHFGIMAEVAGELCITRGFVEWGLLPRTIVTDPRGFLAQSELTSIQTANLEKSENSEKWVKIGQAITKNLRGNSPLELYPTEEPDINAIQEFCDSPGIKILCLGTSEAQGGQYPIDCDDRVMNMPVFPSGWDAAIFLAESRIGKVAYKRHPHASLKKPTDSPVLQEVIDATGDADSWIRLADIVVSWGTKLELNAAVLDKPLILLGTGLLWNKGYAYEVNSPDQLISTIIGASKYYESTKVHRIRNLALFLGWLSSERSIHLNQTDNEYARACARHFLETFEKPLRPRHQEGRVNGISKLFLYKSNYLMKLLREQTKLSIRGHLLLIFSRLYHKLKRISISLSSQYSLVRVIRRHRDITK